MVKPVMPCIAETYIRRVDLMECPACGHLNADDAVTCEACGQPMSYQVPDAVPDKYDLPPVERPETIAQPVQADETPAEPAARQPQVFPAQTPPPRPLAKKGFPWGWVAFGCAFIALVIAACGVVAVLAFRFAPSLQGRTLRVTPPAIVPLNPGNGVVPTLPANRNNNGNNGSGNGGGQSTSLPFTFEAVQNADSLNLPTVFGAMTDELGLNSDTDFQAPKSYSGAITMDPSSAFGLGNGWCAKDEATLKSNMADMSYSFSINGQEIDLNQYPTVTFTDDRGDACEMTGVIITPSGDMRGNYEFKITQHFAKKIEDGIATEPYPAGDVTLDFSVRFQSSGEPGLSG
jgi:hypothetical protein